LEAINSVVGQHRSAVAAGGWTQMDSVRRSKVTSIPRLRFCPLDQPGTRGAALFGVCAAYGASVDQVMRQFLDTADQAEPGAFPAPVQTEIPYLTRGTYDEANAHRASRPQRSRLDR
jgi:hypothetical protein